MTITIEQAIATHGALHVYREIDFEPGCAERMVALGLTAPQTLADVWRAHAAAHAALSAEEMRGERREVSFHHHFRFFRDRQYRRRKGHRFLRPAVHQRHAWMFMGQAIDGRKKGRGGDCQECPYYGRERLS